MKLGLKLFAPIACAVLCGSPMAVAADGSDQAFNEMVRETVGKDTGSGWFDYYVATVNQEIAYKEASEPYGAAGPNGPIAGFDGYVASFVAPDTGSMWFDDYVDDLNSDLKTKGY